MQFTLLFKYNLESYIKRLQAVYSIEYYEIKKHINDHQFCLKYTRNNMFTESFELIPLINKTGINKITHYGLIEIFINPINVLKILKSK